MEAETVAILNTTRNTVLGEQIRVADTSLSRLVGLLGKGPGARYGPAHHSVASHPHGCHAVRHRRCFCRTATGE